MPSVDSYMFSREELLELLIKSAGVHDGQWTLQVTFGFTAGNFGPDDQNLMPGVAAMVQKLGIARATPNSPASLTMDASKVNPAST